MQLNHKGPYPLFISTEYPKFLTENLSIASLDKLKMQEENLQEYKCRVADFEKRRLHAETEAFARQIHETRINGKIYFLNCLYSLYNISLISSIFFNLVKL